jgi:uncharacterized protein (DUF58 family)
MIVPSRQLILLSAAVALPAATVAGLFPALMPGCAAILTACVLAAAIDATRGGERLQSIVVGTPPFARFTKDVRGVVAVTIENRAKVAVPVRVAITPPAEIEIEAIQELTAAPGTSLLEWPCTGRMRGEHALRRIHIEALSPWGLWQVRASRPAAFTFRVYPNLRDRATAALFLKNAPGLRMRRQVGKGREFDNLRHYVPGDTFEDIHWKATARRSFPIVKLYRVEHAQEVYAVIDSSRLSAREGILESYVDAALHLAIVAERHGDKFGLVTFSDRTKRFLRARGGLDHFRLCRETIYNLRAERVSPDFRDVFTTLQLNLRRRALLVFFTSLDDALLAETFEREVPLLARRHLVLVNVTQTSAMKPLFTSRPPANLDAVYEGLAGQMLWNRMRSLEIALRQRGVRLSLVTAGAIKQRVTAEYLEVKRRQVL